MLGVPDPERAADETLAADGARLESLQQDGWSIRFAAYAKVAGANYELPQRIEATRESVRVRLLVDSWGAGTR
jgi:outer membrane biogenesis lipoprotein LolB